MGQVMAPKRTAGGNAKRKMKRKAYEKELRELTRAVPAPERKKRPESARL
jgi:hypothetical protein